jgi:hypothetical protein
MAAGCLCADLRYRLPVDRHVAAYICVRIVCQPSVTEVEVLQLVIEESQSPIVPRSVGQCSVMVPGTASCGILVGIKPAGYQNKEL